MATRILILTRTPDYGGTEKHVVELIRRLDGDAHCTIVCLDQDFYTQFLGANPHVNIVRHPRIRRLRLLRFWWLFVRHLPHVVLFAKGTPDLFPLSAYIAARLSGARRFVCIEQLMWNPAPPIEKGEGVVSRMRRFVGWRTRHLLGKRLQGYLADFTICVSRAIRRRLVDEYAYPSDRTVTIHNGADVRNFPSGHTSPCTEENREASDCLRLLCIARLSKIKRIDLLLDALAILSRSHSSWRCTVLGGGPLEQELRAQASRLGLTQSVTFAGHVNDTRPYLMDADLCVLSSEQEGLPLSLAEAMAAGVPCVASDVGGTGEIVIHGQTGLLFKSGSVEELVHAIIYLIIHQDERRRMGREARKWVQEHFDLDQQMAQIRALLLSERGRTISR